MNKSLTRIKDLFSIANTKNIADVAELVDALGLGLSNFVVRVQVSPSVANILWNYKNFLEESIKQKMLPFTLYQLQMLRTIATEQSFNKAANILFLSQPSLSKPTIAM